LLLIKVAPTLPLSYQGYQLMMVGSFKASIEYRVAVIGTTASVSPLQPKSIKMNCFNSRQKNKIKICGIIKGKN